MWTVKRAKREGCRWHNRIMQTRVPTWCCCRLSARRSGAVLPGDWRGDRRAHRNVMSRLARRRNRVIKALEEQNHDPSYDL